MSYNSFGHVLRISTFGESHGPANVVIIDGVPPGIDFSVEDLRADLDRHRRLSARRLRLRRHPRRLLLRRHTHRLGLRLSHLLLAPSHLRLLFDLDERLLVRLLALAPLRLDHRLSRLPLARGLDCRALRLERPRLRRQPARLQLLHLAQGDNFILTESDSNDSKINV